MVSKRISHAACPHDCPDACGVLITVAEGRATRIQGDPQHPVTRGFLCAKVAKYLDRVYSPERVLYPLRRLAPKGAGKGNLDDFARIVMPGVVTVGLFSFLTSWNEYLAPLIFLNDGTKYTLPVMLVNIRYASFNILDVGALQAGVVVAMIPCLIVYLALQRFYVSGLVTGALRG